MKVISILFIIVIVTSLSACGNKYNNSDRQTDVSNAEVMRRDGANIATISAAEKVITEATITTATEVQGTKTTLDDMMSKQRGNILEKRDVCNKKFRNSIANGDYSSIKPGVNLSYCDLSGLNFFGLDLSNSNLSYTDISGTNLENVNLSNANLRGAIINNREKLSIQQRSEAILEFDFNSIDFLLDDNSNIIFSKSDKDVYVNDILTGEEKYKFQDKNYSFDNIVLSPNSDISAIPIRLGSDNFEFRNMNDGSKIYTVGGLNDNATVIL